MKKPSIVRVEMIVAPLLSATSNHFKRGKTIILHTFSKKRQISRFTDAKICKKSLKKALSHPGFVAPMLFFCNGKCNIKSSGRVKIRDIAKISKSGDFP